MGDRSWANCGMCLVMMVSLNFPSVRRFKCQVSPVPQTEGSTKSILGIRDCHSDGKHSQVNRTTMSIFLGRTLGSLKPGGLEVGVMSFAYSRKVMTLKGY